MSSTAPLAAIDALLAEKRKAREDLDADISALERTRNMLASSLEPRAASHVLAKLMTFRHPSAAEVPSVLMNPQGAWHEVALERFQDGRTHTTAEIYDLAKAAVGTDLGYSAVASWLNRMAERGVLQKDGRGEFSRPQLQSREKPEKTPDVDIPF
ncbi:hypothetical protein [Cystobacter ferrugineus]|uniref:Uncharacterized protein n=1 Tax=Cystobacter ferrugineus TaxID=83449 RepID=A0A1L9AVF6_9BACT|nr:hypothetical protein [Cystobacter ferrugineus]OJH33992.1 hypothetical protein BON30_45925 [Cystobacter ferrugineus]